MIGALLAVGLVSSTIIRHVVQVIPPVIALLLLRRDSALGSYAALPIFAFWLLIMSLIWLYILGLSNFASGTYSPPERVLTVIIGAACLSGIFSFVGRRPQVRLLISIGFVVGFAVLQILAMWLSFHPAIQDR